MIGKTYIYHPDRCLMAIHRFPAPGPPHPLNLLVLASPSSVSWISFYLECEEH